MDWIDIILAKGSTPEGQITAYAAKAAKAAQDATAAETAAESAVNNISSITQQTEDNNALALETLSTVNTALENLEGYTLTAIDNLLISMSQTSNSSLVATNLITTYPDNSVKTLNNLIKFYTTTGQNTDGGMTQKAITDQLNTLDQRLTSVEQHSSEVQPTPAPVPASTNLGVENAGKIVVVGPTGEIIASSSIEEAQLLQALLNTSDYTLGGCAGLSIDYENRIFTRAQESKYLSQGASFNKFPMYGGRMRCNVNDSGVITAFYGDNNYREDGSNGQVMVYQPKFYYKRIIDKTSFVTNGEVIESEQLLITSQETYGFKVHPLFINKQTGQEVPYVLFAAYEGSIFNAGSNSYNLEDGAEVNFSTDKLSSIAGAKPVSGINKNFTIETAEVLAQHRGADWHITNMEYESANQMLEMVEFGSLNAQHALEAGVSTVKNNTNANCSAITGSTSALGNASGAANATVCTINGDPTTYTEAGKRAISYRGVENPWGDTWRIIGGAYIEGDGTNNGGVPYLLTRTNSGTLAYTPMVFTLPNSQGWISNFGKAADEFDWVYIPAKCSSTANSAVPVGDNLWVTSSLRTKNLMVCGGMWAFDDSNGPFYYACDSVYSSAARSYNARLLLVPSNASVINANYNLWNARWEAMNQ